MKMIKVNHFLFLLICSLSACSVLEEPEELAIINIGTDYIIELNQTLQLGPNSLMINVQHSDTQNCANSYIDMSASLVGDQIQLILGEVIHEGPCQMSNELITAHSSFDLSPRQYDINISIKNVAQNHGTIDVSLDRYSLHLDSENGILIEDPIVKIIPDQYAWGLINFDLSEHQSTISELIREVQNDNIPHNLDDGNYGYFDIKDGAIHVNQNGSSGRFKEVFILKQKESFDDLISGFELLSQFPQVQIQLFNSTGAEYTK